MEIEKADENKISIRFGYSEFKLQCYDKENFPDLGKYQMENYFEIKEKDLKELIDRAIFCVSLNNNRVMLKSCSFTVTDNEVEVVCLDGFRMAVSKKRP